MKKDKPALTQPPVADHKDLPPQGDSPASAPPSAPASDAVSTADEVKKTTARAERTSSVPADAAAEAAPATPERAADEVPPKSAARPAAAGGDGGKTPPPRAHDQAAAPQPSRLPLAVSVLALVVAGVMAWQMYELRKGGDDLRGEVAQRLANSDAAVSESRALARQNQESLAALQGRFGVLEADVAEAEGQAAALESLYEAFSRSHTDRVLTEVEHAISIAAQQLQLSGNLDAALVALQSAEARLALPEFGHLQSLRKALLNDIDALKAHPRLDVSGMALRMDNVLARIDAMPLAYSEALAESATVQPEPAPAEAGKSGVDRSLHAVRTFATDVWNEVRTSIRLERLDRAGPELLSPEQGAHLRENLKLRVLTARLALLARDGDTFASDLEQAREWTERYFDMRDARVQRVINELDELREIDMAVAPPELVDTFSALRSVQSRSPAGNGTR